MRVCRLKNRDGSTELKLCYQCDEFPLSLIEQTEPVSNRSKIKYLPNIFVWDIETTSILDDAEPYGFMYSWGVCIDNYLIYGNTWREFTRFVDRLKDWLEFNIGKRLICWVHNLGFETQFGKEFFQEYFEGIEVFAIQNRKIIKVTCGNGLEFRCTYKLSNMSLENAVLFEKGTEHIKHKGDLDYSKIRTPSSHLNLVEFSYQMGDVQTLYEYVRQALDNNGDNFNTIPLTSTGYVRRALRAETRKQKGYRGYFLKNLLTPEVYTMLKEAARGGDTHTNRLLSNRLLINCIDSLDKKSSYPAQMYLQQFPIEKFTYYGRLESLGEFNALLENYALLFRVCFKNLRVRSDSSSTYIPVSKTRNRHFNKVVYDNGRILSMEGTCEMTLTDIDWRIIKEHYTWDAALVYDMHFAKYGLLPDAIRQTVLAWFKHKCELDYCREIHDEYEHDDWLKLIDEYIIAYSYDDVEYQYQSFKRLLNALFGLCYTDPVRDVISISEDENGALIWNEVQQPDLTEALEHYNKSWNSFLVYAVGVWVTAWGRKELNDLVRATNTGGNMSAYWDTDSSKAHVVDWTPIEQLNAEIKERCENMGGVVDVHGHKSYLGIIERETKKPLYEFKALGAKKYAYRDDKGLHITISGVGKKGAAKQLKKVENLKTGFVFSGEAGGKELIYRDDPIHTIEVNGEIIETASSIAMKPSTYTVGLTREYGEMLGLFDDIDYDFELKEE